MSCSLVFLSPSTILSTYWVLGFGDTHSERKTRGYSLCNTLSSYPSNLSDLPLCLISPAYSLGSAFKDSCN